jgi:hypothetical protein
MPPCPEHAPRPGALVVPSLHFTCSAIFFTSAFASVFLAAAAFFAAASVAFASTPPWPEQAPRPDAAEVVPSLHTDVAACAPSGEPIAPRLRKAVTAAQRIRVRINAPV